MTTTARLAELERNELQAAFDRYHDLCREANRKPGQELDDATLSELYRLRRALGGLGNNFDEDRLIVQTADDLKRQMDAAKAAYDDLAPSEHPLRQRYSQIGAETQAAIAELQRKGDAAQAEVWAEIDKIRVNKERYDVARGLYERHTGHNATLLSFSRFKYARDEAARAAVRTGANVGDWTGVGRTA